MRKRLIIFIIILLLFPLGAKNITLFGDSSGDTVGDLSTYFGVNPVFESALSGADADFRMTLKLTGSKRTYKNVAVTVQLPDVDYVTFDGSEENLIHLDMGGVVPTYDPEKNELKYQFDEIERGQMYEKIISLQTENGYIPNDTPIEVTGK